MLKTVAFAMLAGLAICASAGPASATEPKLLAEHGAWEAYAYVDETGNKVCYMASKPTKEEGNYTKRGAIFALVTNRPAESTKNVFSYIAGYLYKPGNGTEITIDAQTFELFTQDDTAWAQDAATDEKIVEAMRKGSSMVVRGMSSRGTKTVDTFSLAGSGAAHDAITKECESK